MDGRLKDLNKEQLAAIRAGRLPDNAKVICLVGRTGAGKTTTLKKLKCIGSENERTLQVGDLEDTQSITQHISHWLLDAATNLWILDMPGIGDTGGEEVQRGHEIKVLNYLLDISRAGVQTLAVLWILNGGNKMDGDVVCLVRIYQESYLMLADIFMDNRPKRSRTLRG